MKWIVLGLTLLVASMGSAAFAQAREGGNIRLILVCQGRATIGSVTVRQEGGGSATLACDSSVDNPDFIDSPDFIDNPDILDQWVVILNVRSVGRESGEQTQTCEFRVTRLPMHLRCRAVDNPDLLGDPGIAIGFQAVLVDNPDY